MKRKYGVISAIWLLCVLSAAQAFGAPSAPAGRASEAAAPAAAAPRAQLRAVRHVLKNGLEVYLHRDMRLPTVSLHLQYHVGSKDEAPGKSGFAHLFEHLMFQGSKHVGEDKFFRYLEEAGASGINGTTSDDRTDYYETVPANQLELVLWLESDRMGFLLDHVNQETLDSQRDVVKNERRQNYENRPYGMLRKFLREAMYPKGHPYHMLPIGEPEDLDRASLEDVKSFFRTYYVPNNASLALAGAFDEAQALALIKKYFEPIAAGKAVREQRASMPALRSSRLHVQCAAELPQVSISWHSPAFFAEGDAELDALAKVLAHGKSSRLHKRLVYDAQIAQSVSAQQMSMKLSSMFQLSAMLLPGKSPAEVERILREELQKIADHGVSEKELYRAKVGLITSALYGVEKVSSRAALLNMYREYTGDANYLEKDLQRYEQLDARGVQRAAQKLLSQGAVAMHVVPEKSAPIAGQLVKVEAL